jgi:sn-glycerol 3-phosphate transport system ATP-binding protein/multiple sugar transport system ATP-binding protein
MAKVEVRGIEKSFDGTPILKKVTLAAEEGEFLVLVGPSGCGKSTLLRVIAGLEEPTAGEVWIGGRRVDRLPPRDRDLAMVFQSYALYPHLTVRENLAFGLTVRKAPKAEIDARVKEAAAMLGIDGLLARYPRQLSGGQRQRVAMGRALVRRPQAFLFDEPLSNLDAALRAEVRVDLKRLHGEVGATMVYVTHDQIEAMTLAHRIAVLRAGEVVQVGPPAELYDRPANRFVAGFLGSPPMNFLAARIEGGSALSEPDRGASFRVPVCGEEGGQSVWLGLRPHDLFRRGEGADIAAVVDVLEPLGAEVHVHARVCGQPLIAVLDPAEARDLGPGAKVSFRVDPARVHLFDAQSEARLG